MRRKFVSILSLVVLFASLLCVGLNAFEVKASGGIDTSKVYGVQQLWNNSMSVNDVAVSKDGNYVAAVNGSGIYYFASNSSNPKWWYLLGTSLLSVAISANGECVVAGDDTGYLYYFNDSLARTGQQVDGITWLGTSLYGPVQRGALDMSDDGEYVVAGGTGINLYYFAGCRGRTGLTESPTWQRYFGIMDFRAVHISSDGRYVAAGGTYGYVGPTFHGFVLFYKDANMEPYPDQPSWFSWSSINVNIKDVALSDDGYAVVAADTGKLYYWANATTLSGDPNATWTGGRSSTVDISVDGNNVLSGSLPFTSLHFWANARERQGNQTETWVRAEGTNVYDVAISEDGEIIAASADLAGPPHTAYFFKSDGSMIGEFDLPQYTPIVSMSGDGRIVAMGSSGSTLHLFEVLEDSTPPLIENVYQDPANDTVTPDDEVMIHANVTDDQTGVKKVILNYTNGDGNWIAVDMTNLEENTYNGTIPPFPYGTNVTYVIRAEDNANNTITTEEMGYEYQYPVIPEFPSFLILPLFMIATLLAVIVYRRKQSS